MKEKMQDFKSKFEGMASIVGSFISSQVDKEKLDQQIKYYMQMAEGVIKETVNHYIIDQLAKMPLKGPQNVTVKIKKLDHFKGALPEYQSAGASGFDVRAQIENPIQLSPGQRVLVPTGLSFEIPEGYEIQARPRSGWAIKQGMGLVNSPGTIDADYRGEVKIILINWGEETIEIKDQDRVAQLVVCPIIQAEFEQTGDLSDTHRGDGGFGSTGV